MKLLCTADQHLGKGQDLGRAPGERLAEQETLWAATLKLARDERCDALLHAGDLFDGRRPWPDVMLAAERPLVDHQVQGGCTVYAIAGNHDVPSQDGPCGLNVLAEAGLIELAREPRTWQVGDLDVCALPWTPLSRLAAADDGNSDRGELAALAADLLLETARGLRNPRRNQILLGHWAVSQTYLPSGLDVGSLSGVVLPMDDIAGLWSGQIVFGHIHRYQCSSDFFYVGSPQPLDFGEAGYDHGCLLLEWDETLRLWEAEFRPLESRRFVTLDVDAEALISEFSAWTPSTAALPDFEDAYLRLRYTATEDEARRIDHDRIRELLELKAHRVWIEPTIERARRDRGVQFADGQTRVDQLAAYLDAVGVNGDVKPAMLERAAEYLA